MRMISDTAFSNAPDNENVELAQTTTPSAHTAFDNLIIQMNNDAHANQFYARLSDVTMQQYIVNGNNQLSDGSTQQYILGEDNTVEVFETTTMLNTEQSSSTLASILATINVLTDEVRKMRAELGETTKKVYEIYEVFIKDGTNARVMLNRRNDPTPKTLFLFQPIPNVTTATIVEKLLGDSSYEDRLVRIYELLLS